MKEIALVSYRKDFVDNEIKKVKRRKKTLRIVCLSLMLASIISSTVSVYYLCQPILKGYVFWVPRNIISLFVLIASVLLFVTCLILFMKEDYRILLQAEKERMVYDDFRMTYTYRDLNRKSSLPIKLEIPWNGIRSARYIDNLYGFVLEGDFYKTVDDEKKTLKSVIIYDYMWDLKMILFRHGIKARGDSI